MKVVIASTVVPGVRGGGTLIVDWLTEALRARGHEVCEFRIPFTSRPDLMPKQLVAIRELDLRGVGDRLITVRTPSYLIRHDHKRMWFIHHHRGAFDLRGTPFQDVPDNSWGDNLTEWFRHADNLALRESEAVFTNSAVMSDRLRTFNDFDAPVLYPPVGGDPDRFVNTGYGDYLVYVARISDPKRQALAVMALAHTSTPVRLVLLGRPDTAGADAKLHQLAHQLGVSDRVEIVAEFVDESHKCAVLAGSLAALYLAFEEDSYGYSSLEAHLAEKAVVGCTDSGGLSELIVDGVNGYLTEPDPRSLAARFDELYSDRTRASDMGQAGRDRLNELKISWDAVEAGLLS